MFEEGRRLQTIKTALIWGALPFAFFTIEPLFDPRLNMISFVVGIGLTAIFVVTALAAAYQLVMTSSAGENTEADRRYEYLLVASISLFICTIAGVWAGNKVNDALFNRFEEASKPLTAAIVKFEKETGRPPTDFRELIPRYLEKLPLPGVGSGSRFELVTLKSGRPIVNKNLWLLSVQLDQIDPFGEAIIFLNDNVYHGVGEIGAGRLQGKVGYWGKVETSPWCSGKPEAAKYRCVRQTDRNG